jgi:PAS domain S-box-containing protein
LEVLWQDGDRVLRRERRIGPDGKWIPALVVVAAQDHPSPSSLARLDHEYGLKNELDSTWAVRPLELVREGGRTMLVLEDPGGEPLARCLGTAMETEHFLRVAIGIAAALGKTHQRGLVHKDIKPANILIAGASDVRLTGFGIASRLSRERQALEPPEVVAGTLAYMAPEQTGRMNRSIDSRSDLYALGVTFYEMLTGSLPFIAADPMELVHCHIARQPMPPHERAAGVPPAVSAIVMKLLAKSAEDRYQTAGGVERDLGRCLSQWKRECRIDAFPFGEHDSPDRLLIPEKLYGREREVETLVTSFDRVVSGGAPELVLVSGYSGIGKSTVVNELHKALVPSRGLFSFGKFDQYKRDIPYATLAQALQGLLKGLLAKSEADLAPWREALSETLGPNGQLMVDLVPELKLIIGDQPPVTELSPQDEQRRFQLVFRQFISVFARPDHPLALFLDDLQWLDAATLDLLEDLMTRSNVQHLMLIGAHRDNEVTAAHPLRRRLDTIRAAGGKVVEIKLAPLSPEHLRALVVDALHSAPERATPLAQLVHGKTGGNPFFAIQFMSSLAEEGLLTFDHHAVCWSWDLGRIQAKGYTDNVVDLMVGKLTRLPLETRQALQQFAGLGNIADYTLLSLVLDIPENRIHAALWPAVSHGLLERSVGAYRFVHDRVQEAAYSLIPKEKRGELHLRIGRLLAANTAPELVDDYVFDIVSQLNRGATLITSAEERERLAELNLMAGKRAKTSTAHASALNYFIAGTTMLADDAWQRQHQLALALELNRAECEFLIGALGEAETRLAELASHAVSLPDLATVTRLRVDLFMTLGRSDRAVRVGLDYLRRVDVTWSEHPTKEDVRQEYARMWRQIGDRPIDELLELPRMVDPVARATMAVLTSLVSPALFTDENLRCLVIGRMGNLSLEHGNDDTSCYAYTAVGNVLGLFFGDYKAGFRFGELGLDMVERSGVDRLKARVYLAFGNLAIPSMRHFPPGRPIAGHAFDMALRAGDLTYAAFSCNNVLTQLLASGNSLAEVQREAEAGLDFARQAKFDLVADLITAQFGLVRALRGQTVIFRSFNDAGFDEVRFEQHLEDDPRLSIAACLYWIRKLQARVFADDHTAAVAAAAKAERLLWMSPAIFERAEYHLYAALARAALCDSAPASERAGHDQALAAHHTQLTAWAENCPENFASRAALVGAEVARLEGREIEAQRLYEQAIRSARDNGLIHNEALASELAARFYAARGLETNSHAHMRNARNCYLHWGADGKVRQLDELYPHLRAEEHTPAPTSTIGASVEQLDLATVIKISEAVSGEIVLEKLIDTLMRTALEHAGAGRGVLLIPHNGELKVEAVAETTARDVTMRLRPPAGSIRVPEAIVNFVARTSKAVILDDACTENTWFDEYIRDFRPRSVLSLPLVKQGRLIALLYLENNLAPRVFTPARIAVLKLLASQAATALENTRLYEDLAGREARIRRLVDANIIGIFIFGLNGQILDANDAFLSMIGYDRQDLASGRVRWTDLTPPEWLDRDTRQRVPELKETGILAPFEKEYIRKDGSRVPVLIGGASFEGNEDEGVTFVLDMTERKRSDEALQKAQAELAHVTRVATIGALTSSVAHEVNQPLAAIVTNADAALHWLAGKPPDLDEARAALERIVRDGHRAGGVIGKVRALLKKTPTITGRVDLNALVKDSATLLQGELRRHQIILKTALANDLPWVIGDDVQLQQVILNLMMNGIDAMAAVTDRPRELTVLSRLEGSEALIAVKDVGIGLDSQAAEKVFEPFYTTKAAGLGMGLAICRSIIESHSGRLWAGMNRPHGAVFQFTVPLYVGISAI